MNEIYPKPGEHIDAAIRRLIENAPCSMAFNDTYVEASPGDDPDAVFERWMRRREQDQKRSKLSMNLKDLTAACLNIGYDLSCGACAEVFFTGGSWGAQHDKSCSTKHPHSAKLLSPKEK